MDAYQYILRKSKRIHGNVACNAGVLLGSDLKLALSTSDCLPSRQTTPLGWNFFLSALRLQYGGLTFREEVLSVLLAKNTPALQANGNEKTCSVAPSLRRHPEEHFFASYFFFLVLGFENSARQIYTSYMFRHFIYWNFFVSLEIFLLIEHFDWFIIFFFWIFLMSTSIVARRNNHELDN